MASGFQASGTTSLVQAPLELQCNHPHSPSLREAEGDEATQEPQGVSPGLLRPLRGFAMTAAVVNPLVKERPKAL